MEDVIENRLTGAPRAGPQQSSQERRALPVVLFSAIACVVVASLASVGLSIPRSNVGWLVWGVLLVPWVGGLVAAVRDAQDYAGVNKKERHQPLLAFPR
jgi:hypothetical protein